MTPKSTVTLATITMELAGTGTTAWIRSSFGMAAPGCAPPTATGKPRTSAPTSMTSMGAGWATGARIRASEGAPSLAVAAASLAWAQDLRVSRAQGLELAMNLTHRNAMPLKSTVTLGFLLKAAGMEITASNRSRSGMAAPGCAPPTVTGTLRTGASTSMTSMAAGWATGAKTRALEDAPSQPLGVALRVPLARALGGASSPIQSFAMILCCPVMLA